MKTIVVAVFGFFYMVPGSIQALQQQASGQEQRSEPKRAEAERLKEPTKYSDVPAKGEFNDNHSNELASDQERRVVRESRYKNAYPEITDPGNTKQHRAGGRLRNDDPRLGCATGTFSGRAIRCYCRTDSVKW